MDWRFFAISLVLLLWAEGGRAQLKCEDTTIDEKEWSCDGNEEVYSGDEADSCNNHELVHVYCRSEARLRDGIWHLEESTKLVGFRDEDAERNDHLCVREFTKGRLFVQATCNDKNCKVPKETILKNCDVGYVKCNNTLLNLNEKMSVIKNGRGTECALTFKRENEDSPWTETISSNDNKTDRYSADPDFVCLPTFDQMMVNAYCRNGNTEEGDNCDVEIRKQFLQNYTYLKEKCGVRDPEQSTTEENIMHELNFFEKYTNYILGFVVFVLIVALAIFGVFIYKKTSKTDPPQADNTKTEESKADLKGQVIWKYKQEKDDATKEPEYVGAMTKAQYDALTPEEQRDAVNQGLIKRKAQSGSSYMGTPDNYRPVVTVTPAKEAMAAKKINCC